LLNRAQLMESRVGALERVLIQLKDQYNGDNSEQTQEYQQLYNRRSEVLGGAQAKANLTEISDLDQGWSWMTIGAIGLVIWPIVATKVWSFALKRVTNI